MVVVLVLVWSIDSQRHKFESECREHSCERFSSTSRICRGRAERKVNSKCFVVSQRLEIMASDSGEDEGIESCVNTQRKWRLW